MHASRPSASDRISDLPDNVIDSILTRLPIRDAVRTSIFSRKWRFKWLYLSQLVFDDNFSKSSPGRKPPSKRDIAFRIYQVLLVHRGPINKFVLSIPKLDGCHRINHVINFLTAKNVQDFTLCVSEYHDYYELPSTLFSCVQLAHLNLSYCTFKPPHAFMGLRNLITLELNCINIVDAGAFTNFIKKCPQLQLLDLDNASSIGHLEIDAPNLEFFCFSGIFSPISFKNAPLLAVVRINSLACRNVNYGMWNKENSNAVEVLGCLPAVEELSVGRSFQNYLCVGTIPLTLPHTLDRLRSLEMSDIYFDSIDDVRFILCLIKSSPNLMRLEIEEYFKVKDHNVDPILHLLEAQFCLGDYTFNHLQEVRMEYFSGAITALKFLNLLLAKSLTLEMIYIKPYITAGIEPHESVRILKEITQLERASPKAKIMYLN